MDLVNKFGSNLNLDVSVLGSQVSVNDTKAILIVVLLFLVLLMLAKMSRNYMSWYMSAGWFIWVFLGFALAIAIEALLLVSGRTIFTEILNWQNAPRPVQSFIDSGRSRLTNILCEE